jgi:cytochrome c-type biogenesis protein
VADPAAGVGVLAALFAGMVSFLSPCVLPLVPGYLSAVTGVSADQLDRAPAWRVLGPSLLFIASFSTIFILLGLTATGLGSTLQDRRDTLEKVAAALIIAMGVFFVAARFVTPLNREWHVDALARRAGRGGPLVAGAAFAVAWTPCVGPTLGAILSAAALAESAGRGAFLLAFYSAGLAIPFLLTALAFRKMTGAFARAQAPLPGDHGRRRRRPDRDGRADLDRRAVPAQHRGTALPRPLRPQLLLGSLSPAQARKVAGAVTGTGQFTVKTSPRVSGVPGCSFSSPASRAAWTCRSVRSTRGLRPFSHS